MRKRVLVTGGAGFLGSHLCARLLRQGCEVLCVDNYFTGTRRNLEWVSPHVGWGGRTAGDDGERLLLADAQTSGGLLVAGEIPGSPVIGELVPRGAHVIEVR